MHTIEEAELFVQERGSCKRTFHQAIALRCGKTGAIQVVPGPGARLSCACGIKDREGRP